MADCCASSRTVMKRFAFIAEVTALALGACMLDTAQAQSAADFFRGSGITINVGSGAGGGFDAYARLLALHYGRHIPGNPSIVVKNVPGANGLVAINALYNTAPR